MLATSHFLLLLSGDERRVERQVDSDGGLSPQLHHLAGDGIDLRLGPRRQLPLPVVDLVVHRAPEAMQQQLGDRVPGWGAELPEHVRVIRGEGTPGGGQRLARQPLDHEEAAVPGEPTGEGALQLPAHSRTCSSSGQPGRIFLCESRTQSASLCRRMAVAGTYQ